MIEEREFRKILGVLAAAHPTVELSAETIGVYYAVLHDLDVDLLQIATLHLVASSKWFPKPSEIRDAAFDLVQRANGVPDAWEGWQAVIREIGRVGYVGQPEFGHPSIDRTVRAIGGWRSICLSTNTVADRARFIQAFEVTVGRERAEVRMLPEVRAAAARLMAPRGRRALPEAPVDGGGNGDDQRPPASQVRADVSTAPVRDQVPHVASQERGNGGGGPDQG